LTDIKNIRSYKKQTSKTKLKSKYKFSFLNVNLKTCNFTLT